MKQLKRLLPALEAVKERDAAAFRAKKDQAEAIRAEIRALQGAIDIAAAELDPSDLASHDAYGRFREASLAKVAAIRGRLQAVEAEEQVARAKLARSHGSVEGCALLSQRAEAEAEAARRKQP